MLKANLVWTIPREFPDYWWLFQMLHIPQNGARLVKERKRKKEDEWFWLLPLQVATLKIGTTHCYYYCRLGQAVRAALCTFRHEHFSPASNDIACNTTTLIRANILFSGHPYIWVRGTVWPENKMIVSLYYTCTYTRQYETSTLGRQAHWKSNGEPLLSSRVAILCFQGLMFLVYPLLGHLADVYLTRYRTLKCGIIAIAFSFLLLFVITLTHTLLRDVFGTQFPQNHWLTAAIFAPGAIIGIVGIGLFEVNAI